MEYFSNREGEIYDVHSLRCGPTRISGKYTSKKAKQDSIKIGDIYLPEGGSYFSLPESTTMYFTGGRRHLDPGGSWNTSKKFFKMTLAKDPNQNLLYKVDDLVELKRSSGSSQLHGLFGAATLTITCTNDSLKGLVYGGINVAHESHERLAGTPMQEVVTYCHTSGLQGKKVDVTRYPKDTMEGTVPPPLFGATLTSLDSNTAVLSGGVVKPNFFASGYDLVVKKVNLEQQKTIGNIFLLKHDDQLKKFTWTDFGDLIKPSRGHHSAMYCSSSKKLVIVGGLHLENSDVCNGERLCHSPFIIDMETLGTQQISTDVTSSIYLAGAASIQVKETCMLLIGGYTSQKPVGERSRNMPTSNLTVLSLEDDCTKVTISQKELSCDKFAQGHLSLLDKKHGTIFMSMGTVNKMSLISIAEPKQDECAVEKCRVFYKEVPYHSTNSEEWIKCSACRRWYHRLCVRLTKNRYTDLMELDMRYFCPFDDNESSDTDESLEE